MNRQLTFWPVPDTTPAQPTDPVTNADIQRLHRTMRQDATLLRWSWRSRTKQLEAHYRAHLIRQLHAAGIQHIVVTGANDHTDLIINGHPVELKFSTSTARRPHYYQFHIRPSQLRAAQFFICSAIPPHQPLIPFIIPSKRIRTRTIEITSHPDTYLGQWSPYRAAYDYLTKEP